MSESAAVPPGTVEAIDLLTAALREKDDVIQAQYVELTEARRQLGLMRAAVEEWREKAQRYQREEA